MSSIYISEPPTHGKVLLKTSVGDIDVELWSKEAPLACRNFVQLALEGRYDGTLFHRVVPDFLVQGGGRPGPDASAGGESIFEGSRPFRTEAHSRLRFSRRGLLATAATAVDENLSEFVFTLAPAEELQRVNTIFGKVVGDTLYNMLKLAECETGADERPLHPHRILSMEVLLNPFDDIELRARPEAAPAEERRPAGARATKNFALLSFGDEAEEDEEASSRAVFKQAKSSHDLLKDPKLSAVGLALETRDGSAAEEAASARVASVGPASAGPASEEEDEEELSDPEEEARRKKALRRRALREETAALTRELARGAKREKVRAAAAEAEARRRAEVEEARAGSAAVRAFREERLQLKSTAAGKIDKAARAAQTMALLASFQQRVKAVVASGAADVDSDNGEARSAEGAANSGNWMAHRMMCVEEEAPAIAPSAASKRRVLDANVFDAERYDIADPRHPINMRKRGAKVTKKT